MRSLTNQNGFSGKEFIVVIGVIVLLCLLAIPPFYALRNAERRSTMEDAVATLTEKLGAFKSQNTPFPATLDENPEQSACLTCFSKILEEGLTDALWYKFAATTYLYSTNGNTANPAEYQEAGDFRIEYDPATGAIKSTEILNTP